MFILERADGTLDSMVAGKNIQFRKHGFGLGQLEHVIKMSTSDNQIFTKKIILPDLTELFQLNIPLDQLLN